MMSHLGSVGGADRQRIVEVFPPTHRRASVVTSRQRIVEVGGGCPAPSRVAVMVGAAVPLRQQPFSYVGRGAAIRWILAGNARPPTLQEARPRAVQTAKGRGWSRQPTLLHATSGGGGHRSSPRCVVGCHDLQAPRCVVGPHVGRPPQELPPGVTRW